MRDQKRNNQIHKENYNMSKTTLNASTFSAASNNLSSTLSASATVTATPSTSSYSYYDYNYDGLSSIISSTNLNNLLSKEEKEKLITSLLESEDDMMPVLKRYLVSYLDKILDNPEPIIKDLIKEKDETIQDLTNKVDDLTKKINTLEANLAGIISGGYYVVPNKGGFWGDYYNNYYNNPAGSLPYVTDYSSTSSTSSATGPK